MVAVFDARLQDGAGDDVAATAPRAGRALAESVQSLGQELEAVRRRLDALLKRDTQLTRQQALLEEELLNVRKCVYLDELTGLPNRRLLLDRYKQAAARATRQHTQVAFLFLDIDGFKHVNDTLGHSSGDNLLQQVATRLLGCIRSCDTAGRLSGDEFVVLLPELKDHDSAVTAAAKIRAQLALPYLVDGAVLEMTVSIGMAICPADGVDYGELLRLADRAMYRDKARATVPRNSRAAETRSGAAL